ncbi:probable two-component response regulator [Streptomyces sp. NBRC 110611]|uniref:response regulator n=1 Tax=Streptomyces sp. NBRC 110611 TaxID=1621259 RepID=UPI000855BD16|nr:response regulator transcription factor [Streptomyces sp. NBRC 110611]GAU67009.1 probable two-component response regulator [Streptomyces sp. NBRC 110611]
MTAPDPTPETAPDITPETAPDPAPDPTSGTTPYAGPVRLLLADDHPVVRAGLRAVLETEPGFEVVADVATAERAVELTAERTVDVVLMDLQFGGRMLGSQATAAITARPGAPRVLVLTTYDTDADILAAIEAGATGYLLKDAPPEELAAAVRTAAAGKSALAPTVALRLMDRMRTPAAALSRRETEVLQLVADGLSNAAISKRLFLSQATVKSHLVHIYSKLGVDSRTAAVAAATAQGLIRR